MRTEDFVLHLDQKSCKSWSILFKPVNFIKIELGYIVRGSLFCFVLLETDGDSLSKAIFSVIVVDDFGWTERDWWMQIRLTVARRRLLTIRHTSYKNKRKDN